MLATMKKLALVQDPSVYTKNKAALEQTPNGQVSARIFVNHIFVDNGQAPAESCSKTQRHPVIKRSVSSFDSWSKRYIMFVDFKLRSGWCNSEFIYGYLILRIFWIRVV
jgi:predicted alpha/beta superfamily hydrolase